MKLHESFPTYGDYDPLVPIRCATPSRGACLHRFFDTSPISPSGRYLAVLQLPFEDRQPRPGEKAAVCVIDLAAGTDRVVAETCGWEPQMGANINWGATDEELFFNDVDTRSWQPFAWKLNPLTGARDRMASTVYHCSPDGTWLISSNLKATRRTQPGYGVQVPEQHIPRNLGPRDDDGFYLTDTATGQSRLLISIADLLDRADPPVQIEDAGRCEIYGFHSKFNPQGDKLMLSLRWYADRGEPVTDMFKIDHSAVRFAWLTTDLDGGAVHCAVGPEQWVKGGHHGTWMPDGRHISMNLNIDRQGLRFVQVHYDGSDLRRIFDEIPGSGHPTIHPDGRHLLTDTYTFESLAYGDGTTPLRWLDLATGEEKAIARIRTQVEPADSVLRIDPHPAWDRTWRYVTFNAGVGGTRRVFIADMRSLLE